MTLKKLALTSIALLIYALTYSQCTPDPKYTSPGIYSSAGLGVFVDAQVGIAYNETVTIIIPKDTFLLGNTWKIDSFVLISVTNLPDSITFSTPNHTFIGGGKGCILLSGMPKGPVGVDSANITFTMHVAGLPSTPRTEKVAMTVVWPLSNEEKSLDPNKVNVAPNPVYGKTTFYLNNEHVGEVKLDIHNLIGENVFSKLHHASDRNSKIEFNAEQLPSGVYVYTISSSGAKKVGRLVIAEN
ncbi:MAG: hypothetical protein CL840_06715 [Crocinitomicaceae bacterium]|nr:hypothetical protein [Crocinitomicaceae bacterium]|tara:strand:- start:6568 stop:7293 length:726 start_codon:yes stop_codon:yes gene_type:complete